MKTKALVELPRKERADRTEQRIVYRRLVDLQTAIWDAERRGCPLGVLAELDTQNLIEQLCKLADIDYRSPAENPGYKPPQPPTDNAADLPIIDINGDNGDEMMQAL